MQSGRTRDAEMPEDRRNPDLRSRIYDLLRTEIRTGHHAADVVFGEHAVARAFSVSRTPAREALALLARRGMVVPRRRGFEFPRFSAREIEEIFEVRLMLEPSAIRSVARGASPEDRRRLAGLAADALAPAAPLEVEATASAVDRVFAELFALVDNPLLVDLVERHADLVAVRVAALLREPAAAAEARRAAAAVIDAVVRGDEPEAERRSADRLKKLGAALAERAD